MTQVPLIVDNIHLGDYIITDNKFNSLSINPFAFQVLKNKENATSTNENNDMVKITCDILQGDQVTRNNRIFPASVLRKSIKDYQKRNKMKILTYVGNSRYYDMELYRKALAEYDVNSERKGEKDHPSS